MIEKHIKYSFSVDRLIILFCVGSIICENRRERKLHPEVYQPSDYRCPCVPSDSCSYPITQEMSPCIDVEKVRCCSVLNISDARIHLGVEPLTRVVTTMNSVGSVSEKEDGKDLSSQIDSVNFTLNKIDVDVQKEKETKLDFSIEELNNRNMKAIKPSSVNIIDTSNQNTKTYDDNKTILERKPVLKIEHKETAEDSIFDSEEMINNSTKIDFTINLNINKSYNDNRTINDTSKLIEISSNSRKYHIVYPNISRVRDESKRKLIVYPLNETEDNFEINVDNINSISNANKTNYTKENLNDDELKKNNSVNISKITPPTQNVVEIIEYIQDVNKSGRYLEDFIEQGDLKTKSEEEHEEEVEAEEEKEEIAEEEDEMPSSSELLEYILKFGKKTGVQEFNYTDEPVFTALDIQQPKVETKTGTKQISEEDNISEENEELETLPTAAASEIVEQIVMPEAEDNLENESKTQARTPIRLPSRNLKLQIQGVSRPQIRQNYKKRNNPLININNSNIKEIINNQKYGQRLEKVEFSKPSMNRNSNNKTNLQQKVVSETMKPSQSFDLDPNLNTEDVLSESRLHPRGIFTPPSNMESGFLPMVVQSDLSIVGPIPLGFQDRSKQNDFLTEDGVRISDLSLPSNKEPQLFFSVYQQNQSNIGNINENVDSAHPELPESEPKDFLSTPNSEGDATNLYEITEDGVYIIQLPLPAEGEPEPFRSAPQNNKQAETDYKQHRTGPADHHNVDIELESKEDKITQFRVSETDDQFNIKHYPQNLEDTTRKINFQLPSQFVTVQNFRDNTMEYGNLRNDFEKDLPEHKLMSHSNDQNVDFSSPQIPERDLQFIKPNQIVDTISSSQQLPSKIHTHFLGSQNDQSNESSLEGKTTQFQHPIRDFKSTQTLQQSNVENANKLRFSIPNFQLPLKNAPINFQTNDNSQQNLPLPQNLRQNTHQFVSIENNQKINDQQTFPATQPFSKSNQLNFAPSPRDQLNDGAFKKQTISLSHQLPQTNVLNFLHSQNEQPNRNVSSEQFPINKQLSQKPLNLLTSQNDQKQTVSRHQSLSLPQQQQQQQNIPLKFKELNNIDPNFHQRFLLSQQLPQTEVLNFAPVQNELTKQQLLSKQESFEPTLIQQKFKENILQKTQQTVPEISPVQNDFVLQGTPQTEEQIQRNPVFQQITKPRGEATQILRTNNNQPVANDHQTRPNTQNQPPRVTQAILKPGVFSSQDLKTTVNSFDTEKTKYDIALEKYRADLKIYQDQYDAFLREKFPSVIRIF